MKIKNDIKAHIVGAGMTMSEVLERLAKEYGWSTSISNFSRNESQNSTSEPPEIQTDRIRVANGTYFMDGRFVLNKEYCLNRLAVAYQPDAPKPTRWLQFVSELLYPEDMPALQEYIGYCLLPVTKAQKMLLMVGKGGEGKSRIGLILRELSGNGMYSGSLQKVETNKFARVDLEYKLVLADDDMKMEALPQTNIIKTIVTLEDTIDIKRKGMQSVQGTLYVRFACFGNGSLQALHDKSKGFYRRQLLLTTKDKPENRADDPFLIDKMRKEKEGILLWALEGLHRLIEKSYQFTVSKRAESNLEEAMMKGNNILGFLNSEGCFEIREGSKCKCALRIAGAFTMWTCTHSHRQTLPAHGINKLG